MSELTRDECVRLLIKILESYRGDKSSQAVYLQAFIQQFGPVPDEYGAKVRELMR